jgi:NADPH:quinone reductase-like Zn-dependent oxidoreductase
MSEITAVRYHDYGGAEVLRAERIAPPTPAAGEVAIDVHAASVNPIDWKVRAGMLRHVFPIAFPMVTGRDGAGVIAAVGNGVEPARIGERVCLLCARGVGSWAERIVLPAALAVPIPSVLSFTDAAAIPLAGISAWAGLVTAAQVAPGMRVLVHAAAGGVGTFAVQIARHRGAHVIGTCSARNADFVRGLGAAQVIAYENEKFDGKLRDIDVVFDPLGGEVHAKSYAVLRKGGIIACLSAAPYVDRGAEFGVRVVMAQVLPDPAVLAQLVALCAAGAIKPVVERVLPFAQFAEAQRLSETGHARGKTVLAVR